MRNLIVLLLSCLMLLSVGQAPLLAQEATAASTDDPETVDAVEGLLAAFDTHSIVAIGEQHGIRELGELYQALITHPDFAQKADAVVMEYGNARYQDLIDAYMNGEDVPYEALRRVWSDAVAKIPGGTEVMYGQVFAALRAVNLTLPEDERIRVLLGDPPIDWSTVETRDDVVPYQLQREQHFANIVIQEVLDQGLKALVITGGPHLDRSTPQMGGMAQGGIMQQIVEAAYPGETFVALVHTGFAEDDCNQEIEARMADWPMPTLAYVEGSWLEGVECTKFPAAVLINPQAITEPNGMITIPNAEPLDGAPEAMTLKPLPTDMAAGIPIKSMIPQVDGYLYVGNRDDLTMSPFDPSIYLDPEYFAEISRRHELMLGTPLDWARMVQDNPQYYVNNFPQ